MRLRVSVVALAVTLTIPLSTLAQSRDPAKADALFTRARELMHREDYRTACPLLVESQALEPAPGTLLNLADCEEHTGDLAGAWGHWLEAIAGLKPDDEALPVARRRMEALDARVPRLTVRLAPDAPAGTRVLRDGVELAAASLGVALVVNPGEHEIVVTAPGRQDRREGVALAEGEKKEVAVVGGAEIPVAPVVVPKVDAAGPEPSWGARHRGSIVVAAGGVVLLGVGVGLGVKTMPDHAAWARTCMPKCGDASGIQREALAANVLFGVAAAAGVTAGVLYFAVERPKAAASVEVVPMGVGGSVVVRY